MSKASDILLTVEELTGLTGRDALRVGGFVMRMLAARKEVRGDGATFRVLVSRALARLGVRRIA